MHLRHIRGKTTGLAPISLNSHIESAVLVLWGFTGVLGVLLPLRRLTVSVGRPRCGGHDVAETVSECMAGVVEAPHPQQRGSGSPMPAVAFRTRLLADRRGPRSNDGRLGGRLRVSNPMDAHPPGARTSSKRCIV
jgi:hypothetical protein